MAKGTIQRLMDKERTQIWGKIGACLAANGMIFCFWYSLHHDAYLKICHILENRQTKSHEFQHNQCAYMLCFSCRLLSCPIPRITAGWKLALQWPLRASTSCQFTVGTSRYVEFLDFCVRRTIMKYLLYFVISISNANWRNMEALDFCRFYSFCSENEKLPR
jgi:hypothetical protein